MTENLLPNALPLTECRGQSMSGQIIGDPNENNVVIYALDHDRYGTNGPKFCSAANSELDLKNIPELALQNDPNSQTIQVNCSQAHPLICADPLLSGQSSLINVDWSDGVLHPERYWWKNRPEEFSASVHICKSGSYCQFDGSGMMTLQLKISIPLNGSKLVRGIWWQHEFADDRNAFIHKIGKVSFKVTLS